MPEIYTPLTEWKIDEGYVSSEIRGMGGDYMRPGSENAMITGAGRVRAFRGVDAVAGKIGSRMLFNVDRSFAGLGDPDTNGSGSVFGVRELLAYIGNGQVNFNGAAIAGAVASSTLSFIKRTGSIYETGPDTGPFQAGHAQPSAPTIYAKDNPSAGHKQMSGTVVVYCWRVSSITGQISLASLASNELTLNGQDVIVQLPDADTNGQTHWGIGVVKIGFGDLGVGYQLPTSAGGEVAEVDLTTIDTITRATEISWSNGDLFGADLIPDRAFPPPAGEFAGGINDVLWLDSGGIIFVGDPNFIGSFPPKNAIFAPEPAVRYLAAQKGATVRFGRTRIGVLYYVGGSPALEYQTVVENQGILYPQNAFLGYQGRICAWLGKPTVLNLGAQGFEPDFDYAAKVMPDFAGWGADQTEERPIVGVYDGLGQYECWILGKMVMSRHAPTGKWNSPVDLTGIVSGDVVDGVTVNLSGVGHAAYIACFNGIDPLTLYQFDAGTGSVMKVQTSDISRMNFGCDLTTIMIEGRVDNLDNVVRVQVVKDYDDDNPTADPLEGNPLQTPLHVGHQAFRPREPNLIDIGAYAVLATLTSEGGDAGIDRIATLGAQHETLRRNS